MIRLKFVRVAEMEKYYSDLRYGEVFIFSRGGTEYVYIDKYTYVSLRGNYSYKIGFDRMIVQCGYHYEL